MGKALYRKYRPTKLDDVIGQDSVVAPLQAAIQQGKISHAYLFTGPRGCGKTSVARIFAHAINQLDYQIEDSYTDIIEIDAASNTGVDNIRELREKAIIAPTAARYKVYIIDEAHMLSKSAFNALLKLLEEPPEHVVFIMATTDSQKVPITITSRAQVYTFQLADQQTMINHLHAIAQREKIKINPDALAIIAERGGGSFRDSISLLDQISTLSTDKAITATDVTRALGLPQDQLVQDLLSAYQAQDPSQITKLLQTLYNSGIKAELLAESLLRKILSHPTPELIPLLAHLPEVAAPFAEAKLLVALLMRPNTPTTSPALSATPPTLSATSPAPRQPDVRPATQPTPSTPPKKSPQSEFSWADFLAAVEADNITLSRYLTKAKYTLANGQLQLYIANHTERRILESTNNRQLLTAKSGCQLSFHDLSEYPTTESPLVHKISAIIKDIQEVEDGEIPF